VLGPSDREQSKRQRRRDKEREPHERKDVSHHLDDRVAEVDDSRNHDQRQQDGKDQRDYLKRSPRTRIGFGRRFSGRGGRGHVGAGKLHV
jgi:hypothetical protein